MNQAQAIAILNTAGYNAVAIDNDMLEVQDPYMGYNNGKYGIDGYDTVKIVTGRIFAFLAARS